MSPFSLPAITKILPPFVLLSAVLVGAQPVQAGTEIRAVSDFEAIALSGSMKVEVRQTGKESVTVTADDKVLPLIETVVESSSTGRTLQVRVKRGASLSWGQETVLVSIEVARLSSLSSSGGGALLVDGLKTAGLKLAIAGSGNAKLRSLTADTFEVRIAGSGDLRADGSAKQVRLSIAGSGDAALADLVADDVKVSIAGSGDAQVHANKSLNANVAGSGDVQYRGAATDVHSSVMGSGRVKRMR